jgi:putative ABC transport system permease protein
LRGSMMRIRHLVAKEIRHRKLSFGLGLLAVALAVGTLVGALTLLHGHDLRTQHLLARKEAETKEKMAALNDDVRKAMLRLGFNLVILPKGQNLGDWYADDYASKYMPEEYVTKLAHSGIMTVRHLLPSLQQKVKWPEKKRTIILVGTRGEVPDLHANQWPSPCRGERSFWAMKSIRASGSTSATSSRCWAAGLPFTNSTKNAGARMISQRG